MSGGNIHSGWAGVYARFPGRGGESIEIPDDPTVELEEVSFSADEADWFSIVVPWFDG